MSEGSTVTFKCKSENDVAWTFNDGKLPPNAQPDGSGGTQVLKISNAKTSNTGTYACHRDNDVLNHTDYGQLHVQRMFDLKQC